MANFCRSGNKKNARRQHGAVDGLRVGDGRGAALDLRQWFPLAFAAENVVAAIELDDGPAAVLVPSYDLAEDRFGEMHAEAYLHSFAYVPQILLGEGFRRGADCCCFAHILLLQSWKVASELFHVNGFK